MSRDDYEFGPHHSIEVGGHYVGGWSWGSKRKQPGQRGHVHGKPMLIACAIIAVMLAADLLTDAWANGAEVAWIALGGVLAVLVAKRAIKVRTTRSTAVLAAAPARQAITGGQAALEQQLRDTQAALAEVLTAARNQRV